MSIHRRYEWRFRGCDFYYETDWDNSWRDELRGLPHEITDPDHYDHYLEYDPFANDLADFFENVAAVGDSELEFEAEKDVLAFLLAFVQHLSYYSDRGEYPRYPTETVIDGGGDCEDTAILMAFIAKSLGYECALLRFSSDGFLGMGRCGHVDLGIAAKYQGEFTGNHWTLNGERYFFVSCNGKGWGIGEYDGKWGNTATIHPI